MLRGIVVYGEDFWNFYYAQNQKVREKIDWTIGIVRDFAIIPEKYFRHLETTDLYEIRVISSNKIFRIFCFFDQGSLVILLNGFSKNLEKHLKRKLKRLKS
jgi:hypothetical protein